MSEGFQGWSGPGQKRGWGPGRGQDGPPGSGMDRFYTAGGSRDGRTRGGEEFNPRNRPKNQSGGRGQQRGGPPPVEGEQNGAKVSDFQKGPGSWDNRPSGNEEFTSGNYSKNQSGGRGQKRDGPPSNEGERHGAKFSDSPRGPGSRDNRPRGDWEFTSKNQSGGRGQKRGGPPFAEGEPSRSKFGDSSRQNGWVDRTSPQRRSGPRNTNSSHVHKAPIDQQFKSHGRQNLYKRPTPLQKVCLDGHPSEEVVRSLLSADLTVPVTRLQEVIEKSIQFWDEFPSETARLHVLEKSGVDKQKLEYFVHSVYPVLHHTCLQLLADFLRHKQQHGTNVERKVYGGMNVVQFIDRLIKKRPMSFLGQDDRYCLPPPSLKSGFGGFEAIGTPEERPPLVLENFLSYDEMRVSALLSLSSWSWFVNDGRRKNFGEKDPADKYQTEGVIVGQVGARLRKEGVMEYVDCVVTRRQNRGENGFGDPKSPHINEVWGKFWGGQLPTFQDANACLQDQQKGQISSPFEYLAVGRDNIFNITVYKKRIAITAEALLCEANTRARAYGKKAYVHVVGLGLGVWRAFDEQDELYIEAWGDAMSNLAGLTHIAYVDFSYINSYSVHGTKNNEKFPGTDIVIRFSKRNLHDKVPEDCILVCNYAWDGNSLPGNEFWMGKLCSTGDSAAACSSCVAEIHTHFINPVVCGSAVRIATKDGQLLDVSDYLKKIRGDAVDFSNLNKYGVKVPSSPARLSNGSNPPVSDSLGTAPNTYANGGTTGPASTSSWLEEANEGSASMEPAMTEAPGAPPAPGACVPIPPSGAPFPTADDGAEVFPSSAPLRSAGALPGSPVSIADAGSSAFDTPPAGDDSEEHQTPGSAGSPPATEEEIVPPPKDIPKEIPHGTIPGLVIPNPEYVALQKKLNADKKNKNKKKKKENEEKNAAENQSTQPQSKPAGSSKSNKKRNKNK